jgi:hypothetical protein
MGASEMQQHHIDYVSFARAKGHAMIAYAVPCCGQTVEGRLAPAGRVWDCLCTCPCCGKTYLKISTCDEVIGKLAEAT